MFTLELVNAIYIWFTKTKFVTNIWFVIVNIFTITKKPQTVNNYSKEYDDVNKKLEEVLQDLSSQFRA